MKPLEDKKAIRMQMENKERKGRGKERKGEEKRRREKKGEEMRLGTRIKWMASGVLGRPRNLLFPMPIFASIRDYILVTC